MTDPVLSVRDLKVEFDTYGCKTVLHARDMRAKANHLAGVGGHHFVDAIAE